MLALHILVQKHNSDKIEYYRGLSLIFKKEGSDKTYYLYNGHLDVIGLTDANGTITTEGTHLEDILRMDHVNQHLQQSSLQMTTSHPSAQQMHVRIAVKSIKIIAFRIYMFENILLNRQLLFFNF